MVGLYLPFFLSNKDNICPSRFARIYFKSLLCSGSSATLLTPCVMATFIYGIQLGSYIFPTPRLSFIQRHSSSVRSVCHPDI